ncbi:hypothetical protein JNUCC42_22600 [Brevibacterium sp. JNUCC-42]|nr:hypothetical protein JNUCC42_22600 [Brevibacterium sp. JNUCC-42]
MGNDQKRRLRGEQKEARAAQSRKDKIDTKSYDTELANDSWMRATMEPGATQTKGNMEYNPRTQTERYSGDLNQSVQAVATSSQVDNNDAMSYRNDVTTETAAEIAEPYRPTRLRDGDESSLRATRRAEENSGTLVQGSGIGMVGLGSSILSLFLLPYVLGPLGIVLGFLAFRREARSLGTWAMVIGALAFVGALLIYPYYATR